MLIDFKEYTSEQIKDMVKECFNTIEKKGVWNQSSFVFKTWINIHDQHPYLNISHFLNELYYEFATRYDLYKSYNEYIKDMLKNIE